MVNTQIIANKLNENLNTIAETLNIGHSFQLMAHAGKAKKANVIEGILKPVNNDAMNRGGTLSGAVKNRVVYVAELIVPTGLDNKSILQVENVINKLVMDYDGSSFTNGDDTIVMEIESGTPKDYAMRGGVGSSVPMAFTVTVNYGTAALLNGAKSWFLGGAAIPYTNEVVILDKDGVTLSVVEAKNQQTIPTSQRKQYKFTIPYNKDNSVCTTLKNDILNGDFRKTYTLTYDDGVVNYEAKVSLFRSGDIGSQNTGDATVINVTFVDAGNYRYYDGQNHQIEYKLGLMDFPFDEQSENTLFFESKEAQNTYMFNKVYADSTVFRDMTAPNLNTTLMTNVVYDAAATTQSRLDVNRLAQLNYAVILKLTYEGVSTSPTYTYYFYWVQKCTQGADGILLLDLKLDTVQTYMFNPQLTIPDCLIERAHLNRWVEMPDPQTDTRVRFNGFTGSPLFEREPIQNFPKMVVSRELIGLNNTNYGSNDNLTIKNFLDKNLQGWLYVYAKVDLFKQGWFADIRNTYSLPVMYSERYENGNIFHPFVVFAFPIVETGKIMCNIIGGSTPVNAAWDAETFLKYVETMGLITDDIPDLNTYIVTMRISQTPPISDWTICPNISFEFIGDNLDDPNAYVKIKENLGLNDDDIARFLPFSFTHNNTTTNIPLFYLMTHDIGVNILNQYATDNNSIDASSSFQYIFARTDIIGANKNTIFNPKLLGQDFTEVNVGQFTSPPFTYDAQKLNSNAFTLRWRESLAPGITRTYVGLTTHNSTLQSNDFYSNKAFQGLIGATISQDTTIPGTSEALADYLSQNKNFYQQQAVGTVSSALGGALGTAALGAATGSVAPGVGTLIGAGVGLAAGVIQTTLNIDNLKNAPSNAKNIDGNAVLPFAISGGKTYIEIKQAMPKELEMANDFMFMNGFTYNQVGNVFDYIHTRKYFNYIKAQISDIQGVPLSNEIRNDIKQRFANGLRFWNMDTFASYGVQYEKENYELWLEDE